VLVAFQVGEQHREFKHLFGEQVSLTFYRRQPDTVALLLDDAGLKPYAGLVREPNDDGFESTPHAYLIAQNTRRNSRERARNAHQTRRVGIQTRTLAGRRDD
jgi:hypothetical protein